LVSADSANELAAYQETANGPRELLETIDKITRKLRGKIGESLREVRGTPPLEQVTTPSLDALRKYAEAQRQIDLMGDPLKAADLLRESVKLDTSFAMAWRKLGVALNNAGRPRASIDSALGQAYKFRERLTQRERLLAEATYYHLGPGRDRRRAIEAYRSVLELDPTETAAANNLANIYSGRREFARAESLYKRVIKAGRASQQQYVNLVVVLFNSGKIDESEKLLDEMRQRFPNVITGTTSRASFMYQRGQIDSMEALFRQVATGDNVIAKLNGAGGLITVAMLRGRLTDAYRQVAEAQRLQATLGQQPDNAIGDSLSRSWMDMIYRDDTTRAVRRMDATLAKVNIKDRPQGQRPYLGLASFFAAAGQPQRARALLAQDDADVTDSIARRIREPSRHGVVGIIALSEGRPLDAIREMWRADTTYDGPDGNCSICVMDEIGIAWRRAGVPDSAIYYWEKYLNTPYFGRQGMDATQAAIIHRWLGELYEAKRDFPNAARHYREFVKRWERADPELQPKVSEVKRRLSRMADVETK
jgi:eukaryotic-like serine/threonine-protein kinase